MKKPKNSAVLTVSDAAGFAIGDWVQLPSHKGYGKLKRFWYFITFRKLPTRYNLCKITAITGTTLTVLEDE